MATEKRARLRAYRPTSTWLVATRDDAGHWTTSRPRTLPEAHDAEREARGASKVLVVDLDDLAAELERRGQTKPPPRIRDRRRAVAVDDEP